MLSADQIQQLIKENESDECLGSFCFAPAVVDVAARTLAAVLK